MTEEIKFTWKVLKIEAIPKLNNLTNVVRRVCYNVTGECQETLHIMSLAGETTLLDPDEQRFTPYFDLTQEMVLDWVKKSIGTQTIHDHITEITNLLTEVRAPKLIEMDLPWDLAEQDKIVTFKDKLRRK